MCLFVVCVKIKMEFKQKVSFSMITKNLIKLIFCSEKEKENCYSIDIKVLNSLQVWWD